MFNIDIAVLTSDILSPISIHFEGLTKSLNYRKKHPTAQTQHRFLGMYFLFYAIIILHSALGHSRQPNIVLFLADDMGYGDLSMYGHPTQEYGAIDRLATEGMRFTQAYSSALFCTPSRASLLTGRQPWRTRMFGNTMVHLPTTPYGLPLDEITIAEALKQHGYTTGMVGKWHLGINGHTSSDGQYLPHNHGFDFVGTILPFTTVWESDESKVHMSQPVRYDSFLYYNNTIIQQPANLAQLTDKLVYDAQSFIMNNSDSPFFLYVSFHQTHTPMVTASRFSGLSRRGRYGDMLMEMSSAVDSILETLLKEGITENTLVVFTSDHGPHVELGLEGGNSGPFQGGKGVFYEGGLRVPLIMRWPGVIEPGQVTMEIVSLMDLFPTFLDVARINTQDRPTREIDGSSFKRLLVNSSATSPHEHLIFYCDTIPMAVRYKQFKVHYRTLTPPTVTTIQDACPNGIPSYNWYNNRDCDKHTLHIPPLVYNVEEDTYEIFPLDRNRLRYIEDVISEVDKMIEEYESVNKPPGFLNSEYLTDYVQPCCNPPYCFCNYPGT